MKACDPEILFHDAMGELSGPSRRSLQNHLDSCIPCRREREAWQSFVMQTRKVANASPSRSARRRGALSPALSLAACALFFVGALPYLARIQPEKEPRTALRSRLHRAQGDDGSWAGRVGTTAFAALAILEGPSPSAEDRGRLEMARQFLTRSRDADPIEELLRGLALLREGAQEGSPPTPQMQQAFDYAVRRAPSGPASRVAPLLRELVVEARRAGLAVSLGEAQLGALAAREPSRSTAPTDWQEISASLSRTSDSPEIRPMLALASSLLTN